MVNENNQFITISELDSLFETGCSCVGLEMKGTVAHIKGEVK